MDPCGEEEGMMKFRFNSLVNLSHTIVATLCSVWAGLEIALELRQ